MLDATFAALADPTRRAMLDRLARGPTSVHRLAEPFTLSQQMISKHIASLVRAQLITKRKQGRESICTLRPQAIRSVNDWATSYRRLWEHRLDNLDAVLTEMKTTEMRKSHTKKAEVRNDTKSSK